MLSIFLLLHVVLAAEPVVKVLNGSYSGLHLPQFGQDLFLGIPYAQDTGGENRFRIPQTLDETWKGSRPAKNYSNACPDSEPGADGVYGMSENCLSINIVRPTGLSSSSNLPVMFWIHGGSYQVGTSGLSYYNLSYIVQRSVEIGKPIIGTSINYRKGGWGNMYCIEGSGNTNLALRDMRKALAWVQENIGAFGGNKDLVTIWGESAGSFAVGQLVLSYGGRTDGLFHQTIQESGSAATAWCNGSDWYQPLYQHIVDEVNCTDAINTLQCLRTIPYDTLHPLLNYPSAGPGWYPTVDGDILPNFPTVLLKQGLFAHVPHLYGTNSDEGTDNAPFGINTTAELRDFLLYQVGFQYPADTVDHILELYPDVPAVGVPIDTGDRRFVKYGLQYKRVAAIVGDIFYHAPRLDDARHYSLYSPTYTYRFNTRPFENRTNETHTDYQGHLNPEYKGCAHFSEVPFVFNNPDLVGPWPERRALSDDMSAQW